MKLPQIVRSAAETGPRVETSRDGLRSTGRLFGGLIDDARRRLPAYVSDFRDGWNRKCAASVFFLFWLRRASSPVVAIALGFLIGGAVGNAIDRAIQGAVVDFVSLHAAGYRWYIFNVADAAIVAGVVGLLYDALRPRALKSPP